MDNKLSPISNRMASLGSPVPIAVLAATCIVKKIFLVKINVQCKCWLPTCMKTGPLPGGMFDDTGEKQNSNGPKSMTFSAPSSPSLKITTTKPVMTPLLISGGWNVKVLPREFLNNSILPGTAYKYRHTIGEETVHDR